MSDEDSLINSDRQGSQEREKKCPNRYDFCCNSEQYPSVGLYDCRLLPFGR